MRIFGDMVSYYLYILQETAHYHLLYRLGSYVPCNQASLLFKGSMECLLSQQLGQDHEPLLLAMVCGWEQVDKVALHIKKGLEMKLGKGEKENREVVSRGRSKNKEERRMSDVWPTKSLEILDSLMVSS